MIRGCNDPVLPIRYCICGIISVLREAGFLFANIEPLFTSSVSLSKKSANVDSGFMYGVTVSDKWAIRHALENARKRINNRELNNTAGIYRIVNLINGNCYVGQSVTLGNRKKQHFKDLANNRHSNPHLQNSYNYYGSCYFYFEVIEVVDKYSDLNEREQYWIDELNPIYNIVRDVDNWCDRLHIGDEYDLSYKKDGETFARPIWHSWVYGGSQNPMCHKSSNAR